MIRILTDKGVSLDIDPSAEFEIEYENPMLDDSHMPVPFSTSITFLSTPVNCKVFGYLSAMMLEPSVKKLSAVIEAGGIPLFYGTLLFDSIVIILLPGAIYRLNGLKNFGSWTFGNLRVAKHGIPHMKFQKDVRLESVRLR